VYESKRIAHKKFYNNHEISDIDDKQIEAEYRETKDQDRSEMDILKSLNVMGVLGHTRKSLNINVENYGWENDYATQIQKHVKGFLTRKKF